jgi:mafB protein
MDGLRFGLGNPNPNNLGATKVTPSSVNIKTGRIEPRNLKEKLAMEEVKNNPQGRQINVTMSDSRNNLYAKDGWVKKAQNVNGIEIHYVENIHTGLKIDFKFKD